MNFFCCDLVKLCLVTNRPIKHTEECIRRRTQEIIERAKQAVPQQDLDLKEK